jgi:hypothetical protein
MAPVLPADTKPLALPSFTSRAPTTMDESDMLRTAAAGSSDEEITLAEGTTSTYGHVSPLR